MLLRMQLSKFSHSRRFENMISRFIELFHHRIERFKKFACGVGWCVFPQRDEMVDVHLVIFFGIYKRQMNRYRIGGPATLCIFIADDQIITETVHPLFIKSDVQI